MNLLDKLINNEAPDSISSQFRKKRFSRFIQTLNISKEDKIIDIGGYEQIWEEAGFEGNITLLNLRFSDQRNPKFKYIECDACDMKIIPDKSFDLAFSNSVIEHVGSFQRQQEFAKEVGRISTRHWIQTPYKYFPLEPHLVFPFFDLLPRRAKTFVALHWKYSHFKRLNMNILDELSRLRLLSVRDMKALFPDSRIYKEKIGGITKSITAYKL